MKFISDEDLKRMIKSKRTTEGQKTILEREQKRRQGKTLFANKVFFEYKGYRNGSRKPRRMSVANEGRACPVDELTPESKCKKK